MTHSRIFVHGLKAHADEMWACGLLIASKPDMEFTEIIRDAKRVNEATENDFVLDCGMKFDGIRCFDHHQFRISKNVDCTFTLIAKTFAPWVLTDEKFGPLAERVRVQDNFGIAAAEKKFGRSGGWIGPENILVGLFEKIPLTVANQLAAGFRTRLAEIRETEKVEKWLETNMRVGTIGDKLRVLICENSPFKAGFSINACNTASRKYINKGKAAVVYGWNSDGSDARTLFKTSFGKEIDFTKACPENPLFCHSSGFLLVFNPSNDCEYVKLALQAAGCEKNIKKSA